MSGVFGAVSKKNCSSVLFYGVDYHSHLGTEYGGMAVLGESFDRQIHNISQTQFKSKFYDDHKRMEGPYGIGVISDSDEQPVYLNSRLGPFCLVTSGLVENKNELKQRLFDRGLSFSEVSHGGVNVTELVGKLITQGGDIVDGIEKMFSQIEGSCSLLLLNKDGIYAARDRFGYTPLVIGNKGEEWAVSAESNALPNLGFKIVKFLKPGEIVLLNKQGMDIKRKGTDSSQICSFLWVYTGFPASVYEGVNVELSRERSGRALAKHDQDIDVDLVAGVPDSGTAHAIGYAMESGKPY
ncbi:MAG TPA: amidophosphoribosyltransferase, partial [Candidatus Omnitrophota bacterium]|nr:amidophosphoribosyltransferase [Candidatus Omnitrophota bacterium]